MHRFVPSACALLLVFVSLASPVDAASVSGSIGVGAGPYGIGIDVANGRAYVANGGSGDVSVVDIASDSVVARVNVGGSPAMVAVDGARGRVYVSNFATADVAVIDATSATVVGRLSPGGLGLAIDGDRDLLYSTAGNVLGVFDLVTGAVVATVPAGDMSWWGIAVDPLARRLYVADLRNSAVVVIDAITYAVIARIPISGEARFGVTVDPSLGLVYVPNYASSGSISVIDMSTYAVTRTVPVGSFPFALALSGSRLYSADLGSGTLTVLETTPELRSIETVAVGGQPAGVAGLPGDRRLYVSDNANARLVVVGLEPANSPPVIDSATISPTDPVTTSLLTASAAAHDAEGDALAFRYQWTRNGSDIAGATASTLDLGIPGHGDKGETIAVRVVASDGTSASSSLTSAGVLVLDSAPRASVSLSNSAPSTRELLVATARPSDADADPVTLTYIWKVNGELRQTTTTASTTDSFDLRARQNGSVGDTITVEVTPRADGATGATTMALAVVRRGG